ncbi:SRPBCC family protein [Georgenia sp. Z1344]|uniref:SRPBCC family protein n=1 Tax=Georgenia sp. Z1344 TaxID=3416706 RepID=UPI003CF0307D
METETRTATSIEATSAAVWEVLAIPEEWPRWTSSMRTVELLDGTFKAGSRLRIRQPGLPPAVWTVTDHRPPAAFTMVSRAPAVVTTAEHVVHRVTRDRTRLALRLSHSGPLARAAHVLLGGRTRRLVELEAAGMRRAAEHREARALDADDRTRPTQGS